MKKDNENDIKNSSSKITYICNIDEKVDRILLENKEKLDKLSKKEFNIENISLKNKKGNAIYYLRKKHKDDENTNSLNILVNKIISEDKKNPCKKLNENKINKDEFIDNIKANSIQKKYIGFNNEKEYDEKNPIIKTSNDLVKSKEFDKIVSQIEMELDKIQIEVKNDVKKIILKKLMENTKSEDTEEKKDIRKKIPKPKLKFHFSLKNRKSKKENKEEILWELQTPTDLTEFKKHETQKTQPIKITDEKEKIIKQKDIETPKTKRHFFKTKKISKTKSTILEQNPQIEKTFTKPTFHVEKIVFGEELEKEEAKQIDKKITKSQEKPEEKSKKDESEIKANKLVI